MHSTAVSKPYKGNAQTSKTAKLLHHRGFHITFVNTEFNHRCFLKSLGPDSLDGLPDFWFETIPDGLQSSDEDTTQDFYLLSDSVGKNFLAPFRELLIKLNDTTSTSNNDNPPVTSILSDGWMAFTFAAAEETGIPVTSFFPIAASGFMGYVQYPTLVDKGLTPLKDVSCLTNGFLDKVIDWIQGMKDISFLDLPSSWRTTNSNDMLFNFILEAVKSIHKASAVVLPTFDALEPQVLEALSSMLRPHVYAIGPLQLLPDTRTTFRDYRIQSMERRYRVPPMAPQQGAPNSVVYVNFGSLAVMTPQHLLEFGWGLANTEIPFFWVIRPDLVIGESAILTPEFLAETKERGLLASWCPQEQVLNHQSVGGFLTHSGWHSTMESLSAGVPMLCWPFFAEQHTNKWCSNKWGIGMEICNDVKRKEVQSPVKELMEGKKGKEMKNKSMEWKTLAEDATAPHGSSSSNLDNLVNQLRPWEML